MNVERRQSQSIPAMEQPEKRAYKVGEEILNSENL
jgi:hypothetical protein